MIDCSAEPSVQAGLGGSPRSVLDTNLVGTINCLEAARSRGAAFLFLSTSRIYPIAALNDLPFVETETRFHWDEAPGIAGFSRRGIAEGFTLDGARSFYGTSKLAGEQLIQEYVFSYGMRALIDRCGVIAGPWQMGKVDQGVITLWVARHYFGRPLSLHRVRRPGQAGPRRPPRARPLRPAPASARGAGAVGRPGLQRRRRERRVGLAQGADRALRPGDRQDRPDRVGPRDGGGRPPRLRDRRRARPRSISAGARPGAPPGSSAISAPGSKSTKKHCKAYWPERSPPPEFPR